MKKYLLLSTAIIVIAFTALVSAPSSPWLINGMTQSDISDMYKTAITPAGFTFSIWSVIYLSWLVIGAMFAWLSLTPVTQTLLGKEKKWLSQKNIPQKVSVVFSIAMILTAIWLVPWGHNWIGTSLIVMLVLLGTLWYLFSLVRSEGGMTRWAVELFMGWIHIATFANLAVWLKYAGISWNWFEQLSWGIGVLTVAFFATLFFQLKYRTFIVSIVYLWASIGIYFGQPQTILTPFLIVYAIAITTSMGYTYLKK